LRTRSLAVAAAVALALGCHAVRYDAGRPPSPRRYERTVHFYLWGLAGKPSVDLDAACPEGVSQVESGASFPLWFAQVATLGLWAPRRVVVTCAEVAR
jgi:hypothetical protein